jgi:hypothetical protein
MAKVTSYQMKWAPNAGGTVRFEIDNSYWTAWVPVSAADLAAIGVIMKSNEVYYNPNTGEISSQEDSGN